MFSPRAAGGGRSTAAAPGRSRRAGAARAHAVHDEPRMPEPRRSRGGPAQQRDGAPNVRARERAGRATLRVRGPPRGWRMPSPRARPTPHATRGARERALAAAAARRHAASPGLPAHPQPSASLRAAREPGRARAATAGSARLVAHRARVDEARVRRELASAEGAAGADGGVPSRQRRRARARARAPGGFAAAQRADARRGSAARSRRRRAAGSVDQPRRRCSATSPRAHRAATRSCCRTAPLADDVRAAARTPRACRCSTAQVVPKLARIRQPRAGHARRAPRRRISARRASTRSDRRPSASHGGDSSRSERAETVRR